MQTFFNVLANFIGQVGASYHAYRDREESRNREEAKSARTAQLHQALALAVQRYYVTISELLYNALLTSADATHITKPWRKEALFSTPPAAVNKQGFIYFKYEGYYQNSNGITVQAIKRLLQRALNVETSMYGFPRLKIIVQCREDGRIIFGVAFGKDVANAVRRNSNAGRT